MTEQPLKVLQIEDNPGDARLVLEMLAEAGAAGFEVEWAERLQEGLKRLASEPADVILLDLELPDSAGLDTLIRTREAANGIPIVVMTGIDNEATGVTAVKNGAQDYLVKGRVDTSLLTHSIHYAIERQRAEKQLREAELRYRTLFEQSPDGVLIIDAETMLPIEFNDVACLQLGYSRNEFARLKLTDYEASETAAQTASHVEKIKESGSDSFDTRHRRKNGEIRDVRVSAQALELAGRPVLYCVFRDITERLGMFKEIEDKRRQTADLAFSLAVERDTREAIMENTPEANLVYFDRDFNFVMVNSTYAESCRMTKEELLGKNHFDLFPHAENEAIFTQVRDSGRPVEFKEKPYEFPGQPWRGVTFWDWTLTPVKDPRGDIEGFVYSLVDVTEKVRSRELDEALTRISMTVNATLDFDDILPRVLDEAAGVIGAQSALFLLTKGEGLAVRHIWGKADDSPPGTLFSSREAPISATVLKTGKPVAVSDVAHDERINAGLMDRHGVLSVLVIPLFVRSKTVGVIILRYHSTMIEFSQAWIDFAEKLGLLISLAMENASLYQNELSARAQIQSHANQLSLLHKIGLSLNTETSREKLLETVLQGAAVITSAGVGAMLLIENGRTNLVSLYYAPWYEERCTIDDDASGLHRRVERLVKKTDKDTLRITDFASLEKALAFPPGHPGLNGLLVGTLRDIRGRARGYVMLSHKAGGGSFTGEDEEIMSLLAAQSSVALASAENFEREHRVAETLQAALLPATPIRDDLEIGLVYQSAAAVSRLGGDFYDFIDLDGGKLAIVIGDVCGKGLEAAKSTAMVKYSLRAYVTENSGPGECLSRLNVSTGQQITMEKFVTAGLMIVDPAHGAISYASAGHPAPIIIEKRQPRLMEINQSIPLGVLPGYDFSSTRLDTDKGTTLLLYTDGLLEARPREGEPFGEQSIVSSCTKLHDLPTQAFAEALMGEALKYAGGRLRDDIALLVIRLK